MSRKYQNTFQSLYMARGHHCTVKVIVKFLQFFLIIQTIFFRDSMSLFSSFLMVAIGNPRKHSILYSKAKLIFVRIRVVSYLRFDSMFN